MLDRIFCNFNRHRHRHRLHLRCHRPRNHVHYVCHDAFPDERSPFCDDDDVHDDCVGGVDDAPICEYAHDAGDDDGHDVGDGRDDGGRACAFHACDGDDALRGIFSSRRMRQFLARSPQESQERIHKAVLVS